MTQTEELAHAEGLLAPGGQISDEDLEAVTGGLTRPLEPEAYDAHDSGGRPDARRDDTGED